MYEMRTIRQRAKRPTCRHTGVKRDEKTVCSTATRRLGHPLPERRAPPKTRNTLRWQRRAPGSAKSPGNGH
jgi:hypothetical protein